MGEGLLLRIKHRTLFILFYRWGMNWKMSRFKFPGISRSETHWVKILPIVGMCCSRCVRSTLGLLRFLLSCLFLSSISVLGGGCENIEHGGWYLLHKELTFADHISLLARSCFYQLRRLRAIRRSVSPTVFLTVVHAFVCTRIDYCNSLLIGLPRTWLAPVHCAVCFKCCSQDDCSSAALLAYLWLHDQWAALASSLGPCYIQGPAPGC